MWEQARSIISPATFAATVSRGRYVLPPHVLAIDRAIVDTILGRSEPILVIEAPPRHGKSELVSKYLPAWYLTLFPDRRVMLASYEATFARTWGRKAREIVAEHGPGFGVRISDIASAAADWETTQGGGMVTAGVGGPLTGKGAQLLIVDDPVKNDEQALSPRIRERHWDWWQSTAWTRLEPGGVAVVMNTRWHNEDLAGRLIAAAEGDGVPVRRLRLPALAEDADDLLGREPGAALWPERWSAEWLGRQRAAMDPFWWHALYQQRPSRAGRMEWPDEYFERIYVDAMPDSFEAMVIAVDPSKGRDAKRGDYSAIVALGLAGGKLYVDAVVERMPPRQIVETGLAVAQRYPGLLSFGVEANQFQELLADEFARVTAERGMVPLPLATINNSVNKEVRIGRLGAYLSRGVLRVVDSAGGRRLVDQMKEFPLGDHDDGPDALEMAVRLMRHATQVDDQEERVWA